MFAYYNIEKEEKNNTKKNNNKKNIDSYQCRRRAVI
jgi:hypothetical protein